MMKTGTVALPVSSARVADFLALTKPRLNSLVVVTTGVGFYLASEGPVDMVEMLHTVLGAALVAGGAAAFNQVAERDLDEEMERTRRRPLPGGRIRPPEARMFATVLAMTGATELALATNWLATVVALVTLVSYVGIYTPLKRRTPWATPIGAIPGALPPMIGWAAARGELGAEAWVLFGIVFFWQLPHFHALSWMYRRDFQTREHPDRRCARPDRAPHLYPRARLYGRAPPDEPRAGVGGTGRRPVRRWGLGDGDRVSCPGRALRVSADG